MNKKNNLAFLMLFIAAFLGLFSINVSAQNTVVDGTQNSNKIDKILQNYITISTLSMDERRTYFGKKLSAEDKANIFKMHLAFQFVKRTNLSNEQKDLILESLSMITPDSYDATKPQKRNEAQQQAIIIESKIKSLFSQQESSEIFASLGGDPKDVSILRKYRIISDIASLDERKNIFAKSSSAEKSNYWRFHLAFSLVKFSELNNEQKEIILDLISLLSPELYDIEKQSTEWITKVEAPLKLISSRALTIFSKDLGLKVFVDLGSKTSTELVAGNCNCSRGSIPACWDEYCVNSRCNIRDWGCGVGWMFECDGKC